MTEYYTKKEVDDIVRQSTHEAVERALRLLPFAMKNLISNIGLMDKAREQFYLDYKDLVEHKELVGLVMEELEHKHPALPITELMPKVAEEARMRLQKYGPLGLEKGSKPSRTDLQHGLDNILENL